MLRDKVTHLVTEDDIIVQYPIMPPSALPEDICDDIQEELQNIGNRLALHQHVNKETEQMLRRDCIIPFFKKLTECGSVDDKQIREAMQAFFCELQGKWWLVAKARPQVGETIDIVGVIYAYEYHDKPQHRRYMLSVLEQDLTDDYAVHLSTQHWRDIYWERANEGTYYIQTSADRFQELAEQQVQEVIRIRNQKVEYRQSTKPIDDIPECNSNNL